MFCSKCGFQNAEGDGFCGRCGAPLRAAAPAGAPPSPSPAAAAAQGAPSPARTPNVAVIAVVAVAALVLGAGGAYVALRGGPPRTGTPQAPQPLPSQASGQAYSDPNGHFRIRYPEGWKAFPGNDVAIFSQSDIRSADGFDLKDVTAPTIVASSPEKVNKDITAAQAFSESGLEKQSNVQILGQRSGKLSAASGAVDGVWVDFIDTVKGRPLRGRVVFAVRRPGDGTATKGIAMCVSPQEAFAAFERSCAAALDSYDFGN